MVIFMCCGVGQLLLPAGFQADAQGDQPSSRRYSRNPEHLLTGKLRVGVVCALWKQHHIQLAWTRENGGAPFQHRAHDVQNLRLRWRFPEFFRDKSARESGPALALEKD